MSNDISDMGKPITGAYNDALVALGLRSPQAPAPARESNPLFLSTTPPLRITLDKSSPAARAWIAQSSDHLDYQVFDSVEIDGGISEMSQVVYSTISPVGRPESLKVRTANTNREIPVTVVLQAETSRSRESVVGPARWLKALQYPVSAAAADGRTRTYSPPPVIVQIGGFALLRALVTTCDIRWAGPWSYEDPGSTEGLEGFGHQLMPHSAVVQLVFTQVTEFAEGATAYNYTLTPWGLGGSPTRK